MAESENGYTTKITGLKRFYLATIYSIQGMKAAYAQEPAFRYEVWGSAVLIPLAFFVAQSPMQLAVLISTCLLVLAFELVNTAIEAVVDRAGTEFHELAGLAKDLGSAVVMVSLAIGGLFWGAVLWENFLS
ncbi:MAG: diacylglycerol kinase [Neptuniibacter sp.]